MNKKIEIELKKILSDKTSGSSELVEKINLFFSLNYNNLSDPRQTISLMLSNFTAFENIQQYLRKLKMFVQRSQLPHDFFSEQASKMMGVDKKLFVNSFPFLKKKKRILTISNSRTLFEIFKRLSIHQQILITISESRPKFEGRIFAKRLADENINVELITESMLAEYVKKCDSVLTGCDAILKNGNVVNKVGSLQLALLCKIYKKPFYVIADKSKFSRKNTFRQKKESTEEVWKRHPKKILIRNYYFEEIPKTHITKIITD